MMTYAMRICAMKTTVKNSVLYHFKVALLFVHARLSWMQAFSSVKKKGD